MVQIINTVLGLHKRKKNITKCIRNSINVFTEQWPIDKGYHACICSVTSVMI